MTIDWTQAPPWARYAAMDEDGTWFWYAGPPQPLNGGWKPGPVGFESFSQYPVTGDWTQTLTERPTE